MSTKFVRNNSGSKLKVLVIDDDPAICGAIKDHLSTKGFLVGAASDEERAESMIRSAQISATSRYSLILLDINLGDGNGLELLARMRSKNLINCPVVVISGAPNPANVAKAKALGVDSFLIKPFNPMALEVRVAVTLSQQKN